MSQAAEKRRDDPLDGEPTKWFRVTEAHPTFMQDADIRARILEELYNRKRNGKELLISPEQYASLLGITPELASFNIQYLLDKGLVEGQAIGSIGTTKKIVMVTDISSLGVEVVEGQGSSRAGYAINFNTINIDSAKDSQIAGGNVGVQNKLNAQGSKGVNVIGDHVVVKTGGKEVEMPTYGESASSWINLGRYLMMAIFKTTDHSLAPFYLGASLSTVGFVGIVALAYLTGSLGFVTGNPVVFVVLVALFLVAVILWDASFAGRDTTCPKCGVHFAYLRTKRVLTGRADLPEADVRNYEESYKCNNCGYELTGVKRTETVTKDEG